jgi:RNA polymerase sigma-70 factor (ECF subfamily)
MEALVVMDEPKVETPRCPTPAGDAGDVALMERLRDGDDQALDELVGRYQHELVGYFYHHCWDQLVAEDLAQTVFIKVFRARERYQVSAKVRTYLYRIAHNAWIDHLRRQRHHVSLEAEVGSNGLRLKDVVGDHGAGAPDLGPNRERLRTRIQAAVEELPAGQRDAFILANNQGLRYAEISDILGIPEGTVKSRMHAAVRTLRRSLADLVEELS